MKTLRNCPWVAPRARRSAAWRRVASAVASAARRESARARAMPGRARKMNRIWPQARSAASGSREALASSTQRSAPAPSFSTRRRTVSSQVWAAAGSPGSWAWSSWTCSSRRTAGSAAKTGDTPPGAAAPVLPGSAAVAAGGIFGRTSDAMSARLITATLTGGFAPAARCAASIGPRTRSAPTIETTPDTGSVTDAPPGSVNAIESPGTTPRFEARSRLTAIPPGATDPDESVKSPVVEA